MTLEELKLLLAYVGVFGVGGILGGGIMWLIVKSFIPAYFAEKGKNLATKEDIGTITREVEKVKNDFAVQIKELEHQKTLLTEGFKSSLSQQQEFTRTANAAVVDLTKKLAEGNLLINWLSWSATQPEVAIDKDDFLSYDKSMIIVLSDLVGLRASVAALDPLKSSVLGAFAQELGARDIEVGKARDLFLTGDTGKRQQCFEILKTAYEGTQAFDEKLLNAATSLLQPSAKVDCGRSN